MAVDNDRARQLGDEILSYLKASGYPLKQETVVLCNLIVEPGKVDIQNRGLGHRELYVG